MVEAIYTKKMHREVKKPQRWMSKEETQKKRFEKVSRVLKYSLKTDGCAKKSTADHMRAVSAAKSVKWDARINVGAGDCTKNHRLRHKIYCLHKKSCLSIHCPSFGTESGSMQPASHQKGGHSWVLALNFPWHPCFRNEYDMSVLLLYRTVVNQQS